TRAAVLEARDAARLHVAVHGAVTTAGGALALADGPLTAAEILAERVAPREVVLTGCSTGGGRDPEAWDGFPSAFLAAGSRAVVATVRTVGDEDAAELTARYYALPDGTDAIDRLAAAQRALIAAGRPVDAWASFAVWGVAGCDAR
ncbi:MAG TPA: CHAT domain-containing protein, partial [Kofleriaceae bacterium]|nr:CHAT domain-containing protein [Kofleriaceae bacterium]